LFSAETSVILGFLAFLNKMPIHVFRHLVATIEEKRHLSATIEEKATSCRDCLLKGWSALPQRGHQTIWAVTAAGGNLVIVQPGKQCKLLPWWRDGKCALTVHLASRQSHQAGSFLKEISAIVRVICRTLSLSMPTHERSTRQRLLCSGASVSDSAEEDLESRGLVPLR